MATRSNYLDQKIAQVTHQGTNFTAPTNLYFGLVTTACTKSTTGSTAVESTATGYARKQVTANSTNFPYSANAISNANAIAFAAMNFAGGPEEIVGWFVADASSGGNILYFDTFGDPIFIGNNPTTPSIPAGNYTVDYDV